jgi:hypothetical protein
MTSADTIHGNVYLLPYISVGPQGMDLAMDRLPLMLVLKVVLCVRC